MRREQVRALVVAALVDLSLVAAGVLVLGLAVGFLWPQLVHPALSERTAQGISTNEVQLAKIFAADGWFVVLGFLGSLLLGALLMLRRRGHEVVVLLLLLGGTYLSGWQVAQPLGIALGPPDPVSVLRDAQVGDTAPVRLCAVDESEPGKPCELGSAADLLSWPLGAALGSLVVLLGVTRAERHRPDADRPDAVPVAAGPGHPDGDPHAVAVDDAPHASAD